MRGLLPCLLVIATGCGAASPLQPPPLPRVVEVAPVHEEPPPPPPKPPPAPTLDEIATRMASALDGTTEAPDEAPRQTSRGSLSSLFGGAGSSYEDARDVMVSFKIVSTTGKYIKDTLKFALDMNKDALALCLVEAKGGERKGTVTVSLTFDKDGAPTEPALKSTTFKEKNLAQCVREGFRRVDPVSHSDQDPSAQAGNRATVEVSLEKPEGF